MRNIKFLNGTLKQSFYKFPSGSFLRLQETTTEISLNEQRISNTIVIYNKIFRTIFNTLTTFA